MRDLDRTSARLLDDADPLAHVRDRFELPEGVIYLDGNSLGALPRGVGGRVADVVAREWGRDLIGSWNSAGWMDLPDRVGGRIARLIGAEADEVAVADSTSVNLFKLLAAAVALRPGRSVIATEPTTFPTDGYIAASVARNYGLQLRWCDPVDPLASVGDDTAVLSLTHVDFRTGRRYDEAGVTAGAHAAGALMLWDLCHTAGAVPFDLRAIDADLAVGCTYKYLNGGPGSPAYAWAARRLHADLAQPLTGWMGHAVPFAMEREFRPADGMTRFRVGTPPILGMSALDSALDAFDDVDMTDVRAKSVQLTSLFIDLVRARTDLEVVTPTDPEHRGSQVSLRHPQAYGLVQALIARGVIGDFRAPDIARFGFAPLYIRAADVWDAVDHLVAVLDREEYADPAHSVRAAVT
jgi:kynureninase